MPFRCTAKVSMPPNVEQLAQEMVPDWAEEGQQDRVEPFQCQLAETEHDFHASFYHVHDADKEIWFCWNAEADLYYVIVQEQCWETRTPTSSPCNLFEYHPGVCDWAYVDPEWLAMQSRLDQAMSHYKEHGVMPDWHDLGPHF
jgi:hypothetical protein